jgi:hypothetical protein
MSPVIPRPESIEPKPTTTIYPNYDKPLQMPPKSESYEETPHAINTESSSSDNNNMWVVRLLIIVFTLTIILTALSYVSSSKPSGIFSSQSSVISGPI